MLLFILWCAGVEGGGGGKGGWLTITIKLLPSLSLLAAAAAAVVACQMSPLVTKWEITHVMGHSVSNPKPMPQVQVFWGYRISNPYPYPREACDIPYVYSAPSCNVTTYPAISQEVAP